MPLKRNIGSSYIYYTGEGNYEYRVMRYVGDIALYGFTFWNTGQYVVKGTCFSPSGIELL